MQRSVIDLQLHVAGAPTGNSPIRDRAAAASEFEPFLPKQNAKPGDTWMAQKTAVLPFLRQIHAGAKTDLHVGCVGGPGTFACLLARDASTIDVLFRSHAEFDLANGTTLPTPAQFEGRLQWSVTDRAPLAFRLAVPDRDTNYDLNAPQGDAGMSIADIGYRPTMELASARAPDASTPVLDLLDREFINCWILAKDLEAIAKSDAQQAAVRTAAAAARKRYDYPVDTQIMRPDGAPLSHVGANDLFSNDMDERSLKVLNDGLAAFQAPAPASRPAAGH